MTGLLPDVIRHAVDSRSTYAASASYGVVTLVTLLVLLVEWQVLQLTRNARGQGAALAALATPLLLAVLLTIGARIEILLP